MNMFDLTKATVVCGGLAFLIYSFPLFSQISLIVVLTLMWLMYARDTITAWRRKRVSFGVKTP